MTILSGTTTWISNQVWRFSPDWTNEDNSTLTHSYFIIYLFNSDTSHSVLMQNWTKYDKVHSAFLINIYVVYTQYFQKKMTTAD